MTEKRSKKMEGEFTIKPDSPTFVRGRKLTPRELAGAKRLASMTERFARADLDPERGTNDVFLGRNEKCVLLGLRCEQDCPCLQCKAGMTATSEIRYLIDINLGLLHRGQTT